MSVDPEAMTPAPAERAAKRPPNRGWLWFFIVVGVLTLGGVALEIWFNHQQQLTLERVERAWALWKQSGPPDYTLDYTVDERDGAHDAYTINVRDGKAISANRLEDGRRIETDRYPYATMEAIFGQLEEWIKQDERPDSSRVFMTATFDRRDGHLFRVIRSIASTRQRTEITVKLRPPPE